MVLPYWKVCPDQTSLLQFNPPLNISFRDHLPASKASMEVANLTEIKKSTYPCIWCQRIWLSACQISIWSFFYPKQRTISKKIATLAVRAVFVSCFLLFWLRNSHFWTIHKGVCYVYPHRWLSKHMGEPLSSNSLGFQDILCIKFLYLLISNVSFRLLRRWVVGNK